MRLKNPKETPHGGFQFFYYADAPDGKRHLVHVHMTGTGKADPISQLTENVINSMRVNNVDPPDELREIIEHQICLRQPNPEEDCFSGGIGDDIHHKWMKPFLNRVVEATSQSTNRLAKLVHKTAKQLSNCGKCAGETVYSRASKTPMGRAGVINKITR